MPLGNYLQRCLKIILKALSKDHSIASILGTGPPFLWLCMSLSILGLCAGWSAITMIIVELSFIWNSEAAFGSTERGSGQHRASPQREAGDLSPPGASAEAAGRGSESGASCLCMSDECWRAVPPAAAGAWAWALPASAPGLCISMGGQDVDSVREKPVSSALVLLPPLHCSQPLLLKRSHGLTHHGELIHPLITRLSPRVIPHSFFEVT